MRFILLFLLLGCHSIFGQSLELQGSMALEKDRFVGFDNYQNLYTLKGRSLYKEGSEGNFVYNSLQLGRITSVDIINPLKIVVFFQDTNSVVLLDNKLNEIDRIHFNRLGTPLNIGSATTAGSNSLWIFNLDHQQLELYDYKTRTTTTVSQPFPGTILSQASNFNYCFLLTNQKLRAFNVYGSFLNQVELKNFEKIQQENENVLVLKQNKLYFISDFAKHKSKSPSEIIPLEIEEISVRDFQLMKDFVHIFDGKLLHTFRLNIPKKD